MDVEDYEFLKNLAKEKREEVSKAVREIVDLGRVMLAIEEYKNGKVSIGRASEIAGISISEMMDVLTSFGVNSNVTYEDYLRGMENLKKVW